MMAQMLSRPAIRPAPGLRSPKLLFPLRDAAPMTERRRIVAAKATAASTAPVYLTGAGAQAGDLAVWPCRGKCGQEFILAFVTLEQHLCDA